MGLRVGNRAISKVWSYGLTPFHRPYGVDESIIGNIFLAVKATPRGGVTKYAGGVFSDVFRWKLVTDCHLHRHTARRACYHRRFWARHLWHTLSAVDVTGAPPPCRMMLRITKTRRLLSTAVSLKRYQPRWSLRIHAPAGIGTENFKSLVNMTAPFRSLRTGPL